MKFKLYDDVNEFYKDTYEVLLRHEVQNMILLGNLIIGYQGTDKTDWRDPLNWVMATVSDQEKILLTALMTPPFNITLYATDNIISIEALDCLIAGLSQVYIPGVVTEKALALAFAERYSAIKKISYSICHKQRIYQLERVNQNIDCQGKVRPVSEKDMSFLPFWDAAFQAAVYGKTEINIPEDSQKAQYRIDSGKIYVLEVEGTPVSIAGFSRELPTAVGLGFVYTPPYFREKGYASSIVTQLSQMALDRGYKKCVLYADLANPVSNSIYMKIGYVPVCDSLMLNFENIIV
ncbi:MAG TPA: GNAT family N-acetyltransferase [Erysipelotrichaceae bacterium]|nr:GNAT family N-acetyltransferase [Erysipelotrichaceae bacterium]